MPDSSPPRPGERLGRYRLVSHLGSGGMGVVFLAQDERLEREVAIKFLPQDVAGDPDRLKRFEQEAVAASKLNHPNIVVVHELGEEGGRHYLVTERVEGESLRQRLDAGPLAPIEVIEIAAQTAAALAAAHKAGIVHRDVKPENLMLRPDGWIKLLDFGLAKVGFRGGIDSQLNTQPGFATAPGVVLGTVRYMSPEQARGEVVDARSDLFSLGAVLYEMVTGRPPFSGPSAADIMSAVLREQPPPIERYVDDAPEALALVLSRCLRKSPDTRYQSAEELLEDLRELRAQLERSPSAATRRASGSVEIDDTVTRFTGDTGATRPARRAGAPGRSGSSFASVANVLRRRRRLLLTLLGVTALAAVVVLVRDRWPASSGGTATVFANARPLRVTQDGRVVSAVVTPDALNVLYAVENGKDWTIRLRRVRTGSDVEIVPPGPERLGRLALSPDGEHLFYVIGEEDGVLMRVPVLGGTPVQLVSSLESSITFDPSGQRFAYLHWNPERGVQETVIAFADGSPERTLLERSPDRAIWPQAGLAWRPDGQSLAAVTVRGSDERGSPFELISIPIAGGEPTRLSDATFREAAGLTWRPDGRALVMAVEGAATAWLLQLVEISLPDGEVHPITSDLESYQGASLTADGRQVLSVRTEVTSFLWSLPAGAAPGHRPTRLTQGGHDGVYGLAATRDGAVVHIAADRRLYRVEPNGRDWLMTPDDNALTSVTGCPNGDLVVGSRRPIGGSGEPMSSNSLWRFSSRAGAAQPLTFDIEASPDHAICAADQLIYRDFDGATPRVFRAGPDGGPREALDPGPNGPPALSPDGTRVAFFSGLPHRIRVVPARGGEPLVELDPPPVPGPAVVWAPDGQALVVVVRENGIDDLWRLPLDGSAPTRLTDFGDLEISAFTFREDGELLLARGSRRRDAVLLTAGD